jgi:hypothetical protein
MEKVEVILDSLTIAIEEQLKLLSETKRIDDRAKIAETIQHLSSSHKNIMKSFTHFYKQVVERPEDIFDYSEDDLMGDFVDDDFENDNVNELEKFRNKKKKTPPDKGKKK